MKKIIPLFIIAAGLVIAGYGGFKLIDTNMKTEQTLKEAKLAAEKPQELLGTKNSSDQAKNKASFKPETGQASGHFGNTENQCRASDRGGHRC